MRFRVKVRGGLARSLSRSPELTRFFRLDLPASSWLLFSIASDALQKAFLVPRPADGTATAVAPWPGIVPF